MANEVHPQQLAVPWRRWFWLAIGTFVVGYSAVIILFTLFQRDLIYVPTKLTPELAEEMAAKSGFVPWRNAAGQLMGWKLPANGESEGSFLMIHGNAGWALNRAYIALPIHEAGPFEVYIMEYPGFGARGGSPNMASVLAAGEEAFDQLPKNLPAYLISESLGTGVAAHLAQNNPANVAGIAMFVPYDKLASVAADHVPFIPAYYLLRDRFEPAQWLKNYHGPISVIVAGADEIISPVLGQRLYDSYDGPKQLLVVPGARHIDTGDRTPEWWREVLAFWQANPVTNKVAAVVN